MEENKSEPKQAKAKKKKAVKKAPKMDLVLIAKAPWGNLRQPVDSVEAAARQTIELKNRYEPMHKIECSLVDEASSDNWNKTGELMDALEDMRINSI